ncbi:hypothetical protein SNE40_000167 [Patella caerulea]|uniref:Myosin motor domain-containing protein n=1 Tax=Patella caerulea TaxID=87958 RepID=A0AAN8K9Y3_PATCE
METEIYQSTLEALPEKERLKITKQIRKRQIENYIQNTANDNLELGRPRKPNKKNTKVGFNSNYRVQEAIEDGDDLQVQKLAKERFDPNFTTGNGLSLLHKCCIEGNVTSAEIIISRGADVNKQDDDWWTPLHVACYRDNPELIQLLLNNGSNVKILDVDNNFPIDYAPLGSESWSIMCNHHNDNGIDKEMLKKIRMEGSSCVKLEIEGFVNHGVNVSKPLTEGITWLHIVCANGYKKALKLLLDNRADVNAVDYNGWTPLHVAAKYGEKRVVEILMNNEARTDVIDVHGFRPVDVAATEDIQKLLVEAHKKRLISSTTSQESGLQFEDEEDDDSYVTKAIRPKELPLSKAEKLMEAQMRFQYLEDDKIHRLGTHKGNDHSDNGEIVSSILKIRQSKEACLPSTGPSDDLIGFKLMTEKLMVDTLEERFRDHKIYTDIGDILLAVNPFETLPYYSKEVSKKYNTTEKLTHLPPHIYATAERCLRGLKASRGPQCCIIGGESGTGKTESCKCIIKHLVDVSDAVDNQLSHKIEQINPLLEAFGNAQTVMNDNSSRYAKLLEIKFNSQNIISGACLKEYLVEKCRVVHQSEQELNFHIFYWMLAGLTPEECRSCLLDKNKPYRYLGGNVQKTTTHMTLDNKQKFWEVKESLKFLGFTQDDLTSVINVLAAILHIGNITFSKDAKDNARVTNQEALRNVSVILRIPFEDLMSALVEDVIITRGEQTKIILTVDQAIDSCDALAKTLYSRLFSWIVNGINQMVQPDEDSVNSNLSISILDLFGFENLQTNSFEQMCINIANEQLQMYFVDHVFKLEEADCVSEGIESSSVTVPWTDLAISLFLEKGSGVLALLDEECAFPKASDKTLATKLHHGPGKKFKRIYKEPRDGGVTFTVVHYAGAITYTLTGILDKNRDKLRHHLSSTMRSSSNLLFKDLFQTRLSKMGSLTTSNRQVSMKKNNKTSNVFMKMKFNKQVRRSRIGQPNKHATKRPPATMSYHFRNSLKDMMTKISYCQTHFVRCFKPNSEKKPSLFVRDYIQAQLRYTGVLETVRIRKNGYAHRIRFVDFLDRYKCLSGVSERRNKRNISIVNQITNILTRWRIENFRIGKTKVFLRHGQTERLDTAENYFLRMIIKAQSVIRGFGVRRKMVIKYSKRERNMSHIEVFGNLIGRNQQRVFQLLDVQRDHDTVKFQRQQKDDVEAAIGFLDSVIENEPLYINLPTREEVDSHYRQQDVSVSDQSGMFFI